MGNLHAKDAEEVDLEGLTTGKLVTDFDLTFFSAARKENNYA